MQSAKSHSSGKQHRHQRVGSFVRVPRGIIMSATELSHGSRVVGVLIGSMCGDVLGAGVEGWDANKILKRFPKGLVDFLRTDRG